jgi:hypothetical protein
MMIVSCITKHAREILLHNKNRKGQDQYEIIDRENRNENGVAG